MSRLPLAPFIFFGAIVACGIVGSMDYEDAQREANHYCEMVALYSASNGEMGWPDYRGDAKEICND